MTSLWCTTFNHHVRVIYSKTSEDPVLVVYIRRWVQVNRDSFLCSYRTVSAQESPKWAWSFLSKSLFTLHEGRSWGGGGWWRKCWLEQELLDSSLTDCTWMLTVGTGRRRDGCGWGSLGSRLVWEWAGEGGQEIFRCRVMLRDSGGTIYSSINPHSPRLKYDLWIAVPSTQVGVIDFSTVKNKILTCQLVLTVFDCAEAGVDGETGRKEGRC